MQNLEYGLLETIAFQPMAAIYLIKGIDDEFVICDGPKTVVDFFHIEEGHFSERISFPVPEYVQNRTQEHYLFS